MKIRINQDIVEFTPENPAEKQSWRRSGSRCPTVSARRSVLNQWAPTFPVRTKPQCSTLKVFPKKNLAQFLPFVRRMTRMFTVRRATRPFTSKRRGHPLLLRPTHGDSRLTMRFPGRSHFVPEQAASISLAVIFVGCLSRYFG